MQRNGDRVRRGHQSFRQEREQFDRARVADLGRQRVALDALAPSEPSAALAAREGLARLRSSGRTPAARPWFVFRLDLVDDRLAGRDPPRAERRAPLFFCTDVVPE